MERFLTDLASRGESGYRLLSGSGTQYKSSLSPKKVRRIAIFTFIVLVLGLVAYARTLVSLHASIGSKVADGPRRTILHLCVKNSTVKNRKLIRNLL